MPKSKNILALDIGSSGIKAAEFAYPQQGGTVLKSYDCREYDEELTDENRTLIIAEQLRSILEDNNFTTTNAYICISGQSALTRFVKLPPVAEEESRVRQIVEYEARQNVPFSMEEVVWDYQLIASPEGEELEVMFVVVKNQIVEQITQAVSSVGLSAEVVDVAPAAGYNAARANGAGAKSCEMILDLGGHSTNLLFADQRRFFARTIPIAGHSITQQIAKEFGVNIQEAETLKRKHGFVALGGPYAEPESETAAAVSKIVRNVMTRLHGEINRSIGVYKTQQKGNSPTKLYLTGGSSVMPYSDRFFADKLNMEVEYLNPFKAVQLDPAVDAQTLEEKAHAFSQVVGLGLRHERQMPVEVSLIPESICKQIALKRKKPYIAACVATVLLMLVFGLLGAMRKKTLYQDLYLSMEDDVTKLEQLSQQISTLKNKQQKLDSDYQLLSGILAKRLQWPQFLSQLENLSPQHLWLTNIKPILDESLLTTAETERERTDRIGEGGMFSRMGVGPTERNNDEKTNIQAEMENKTIDTIEIKGHSLALPVSDKEIPEISEIKDIRSSAPNITDKSDITPEQIFLNRLDKSELFKAKDTKITSYRSSDQVRNLKSFTIQLKLEDPIKIKYD